MNPKKVGLTRHSREMESEILGKGVPRCPSSRENHQILSRQVSPPITERSMWKNVSEKLSVKRSARTMTCVVSRQLKSVCTNTPPAESDKLPPPWRLVSSALQEMSNQHFQTQFVLIL